MDRPPIHKGNLAMHALINGVRLFFDVGGTQFVPDGPAMREKPTLRPVGRPEVLRWFTKPGGESQTFDLFPDLHRIRCPTLVMGGEDKSEGQTTGSD